VPLIRANGINLYYEERGQGEPLLLMAPTGWPGSVWELEQVRFLAHHFRVINYDQRGIGRSDQPDEEYTTDLLADDALALLHAIDATPAHLLGFSMGGRIAQLMVLEDPSAVRSMVLAATDAGRSGVRSGVSLEVALSLGEHGYPGYFADHLNHDFPFSPAFRERHPEKVQALAEAIWARRPPLKLYLRHIMARGSHDAAGRLGAISVPVLVMVGADDRLSRGGSDHVASARALAGAIPGAQLVEIAGARHLFPWEAPEQTNRLLLEFFARHSAHVGAPA
jgi:pimeloyl-ACP methyl ester carboxylesterase